MHTWISSLGQSGNLQNSGDWTISEIDHIADTVEDNAGFSPGVHDIAYFLSIIPRQPLLGPKVVISKTQPKVSDTKRKYWSVCAYYKKKFGPTPLELYADG